MEGLEKKCTRCKVVKPIDKFSLVKRIKGRDYYCRKCRNELGRLGKEKRKEKLYGVENSVSNVELVYDRILTSWTDRKEVLEHSDLSELQFDKAITFLTNYGYILQQISTNWWNRGMVMLKRTDLDFYTTIEHKELKTNPLPYKPNITHSARIFTIKNHDSKR